MNYEFTTELLSYGIDEIIFKKNPGITGKEFTFQVRYHAQVSVNEIDKRTRLILDCEISDEQFSRGNDPFYIKARIVGDFKNREGFDEIDYQNSATAQIYPYLNAFLSWLTVNSGFKNPLILPFKNLIIKL